MLHHPSHLKSRGAAQKMKNSESKNKKRASDKQTFEFVYEEDDGSKNLPGNVQRALDLAKKKNTDYGKSDFYYRLENLTSKIEMFKNWTPFRPGLLEK
jgi:hypothetical protein